MNRIHPTAVIGDDVELGDDNEIGPYVVLVGRCRIGDGNWIGPHVVIGTPPEMRGELHSAAWSGDPGLGEIVIGSRNVLREFTVVQQSLHGRTTIGDDGYFMDKVHIPHDARIGDGVTLSCAVMIAGHVVIGDRANLGLSTVVHQRVAVGEGAMIGMGSVVTKHIPPFALAYGSPARVHGANRVGLRRAGIDDESIDQFDQILRSGGDIRVSMPEVAERFEADVSSATAS